MSIKDTLFALTSTDSIGNLTAARDKAFELMSEYAKCEKSDSLTVTGFLKGGSDYTLMLDAHIDQVGFIVTNVDDKGFLTVEKAGGTDIRSLPARRVTVHGKEKISAVFCSTPPHLASGEKEYGDITEIKLDTLLGSKAKDLISLGDYVTYENEPCELRNGRVLGRSFDDRAGVACLIEIAKRLSGKKLPFNVTFVMSDGEELGLRGIRPASFRVNPNEAIAIDVSFGDGLGICPEESAKLGSGAMVGASPALDRGITNKLLNIAKEKNIPATTEVMSGHTGTNADMIGVNREGVRTCTVSVPIRNMHTDVEILDIKDLESVCNLICEYILSGGVMNDRTN